MEQKKDARIRKDGQPYGSPRVRMSKRAELQLHNGESLKEEEPEHQPEVKEPVTDADVQPQSDLLPAVTHQKPTILSSDADETVRKFLAEITLDQKGIRDKDGNFVDENNNTFKSITYESVGNVVDIARAAGRIANEVYEFYEACKGKGIKRKYGFNVNIKVIDEVNGERKMERLTIVEKLRLSNCIDISYAVGTAVLRQLEGENSDAYFTGAFKVSDEGKLFLAKMKFDAKVLNLPYQEIKKRIHERKLEIKRNVKANVKQLTGA